MWTEVQSGDGAVNFITGMGGFLQAVLSGYGGLRLDVDELRFHRPALPQGVTELTFRGLSYLGAQFDLEVLPTAVFVRVRKTGEHPLVLINEFGVESPLVEGELLCVITVYVLGSKENWKQVRIVCSRCH